MQRCTAGERVRRIGDSSDVAGQAEAAAYYL